MTKQTAAKVQRSTSIDFDRISWDDLRLLASCAREASFRQAATSLKIASSTITRRIDKLEKDLGIKLFDRLPEGVSVTPEGRLVVAAVEDMERASLGVRASLDRDIGSRGLLRCSVTEGLGTFCHGQRRPLAP
jgi:DNA-binding transcriptional LysR family regulator